MSRSSKRRTTKRHFQTDCVWGPYDPAEYDGSMSPPIYQTSLFTFKDYKTCYDALWHRRGYLYSRSSNPTRTALEKQVACLEGGQMGLAFASGCAAISTVIFNSLKQGDHVIAPYHIYFDTYRILSGFLKRFGVETTFIQGTHIDQFKKALRPNTRLIYLESPGSTYFYLQPIRQITNLARRHKITTIIDNSLATPYNQQPLKMGVDFVLHSMSKYIGGHSDIVAGVLVGRRSKMRQIQRDEYAMLGGILAPFDSWLALRGLRTLGTRVKQINATGLTVAKLLRKHSKIKRVYYAGLPDHPNYQLAKKQMTGFSGLITFELKQGSLAGVKRFIKELKYFKLAVSWGGYESLVIPFTNSPKEFLFGNFTENDRARLHAPGTIRLSVGLEDPADLIKDLTRALRKV